MTYKVEMVHNSIGWSKCDGASMHVRALCQQGMGSVPVRGPSVRKQKREYGKIQRMIPGRYQVALWAATLPWDGLNPFMSVVTSHPSHRNQASRPGTIAVPKL